jgi:hypothetical protein
MIPFDPADIWSWTTSGITPPDQTQDALRGGTVSPGSQRRVDVVGGSTSRAATITPGSVRRTN